MVHTAWMFIIGASIIGYLLPLALLMSKEITSVYFGTHLASAVAFGLIAASIA